MNFKILGYGLAHPENKVTNHDLSKVIDTSDEWIKERTGIESRYISTHENTSDLAIRAARKALEDARIDPQSIDGILVATFTPDGQMPSTAGLVQAGLGLNDQRMLAFDINGACTGFILTLQTANALIEAGLAKTILVIGAETLSKILDYNDRTTCVLFGDGAGAILIQANSNAQKAIHYSNSRGDTEESLVTDKLRLNPSLSNQAPVLGYLRMKGQAVFRFAVFAMEDAIKKVLMDAKLSIHEIDWIVPHQANLRILSHVANKLGIEDSKFYANLQEYGNTSSASIPIALAEMNQKGLLKEKQKIILVGFGAGLAWGASLLEL